MWQMALVLLQIPEDEGLQADIILYNASYHCLREICKLDGSPASPFASSSAFSPSRRDHLQQHHQCL